MGTDLETTVEKIEWQIKYYKECCRPKNNEEIEDALEVLIFALNKNKPEQATR